MQFVDKRRIPKVFYPKFQGGGLFFDKNDSARPVDGGQLTNVLIQPNSEGFNQTLQVVGLQNQAAQLNTELYTAAIRTKLQQEQLDLQKKQYEDQNLRYILKERANYMDKITGDDIDPIFSEKLKGIQDKYKINSDTPLTMEGLAEQQRNLQNYYNDTDYRTIKEYSTLIKTISNESDKISDVINKYKLEDPEGFANYNIDKYEEDVRNLRKQLIEIGTGDVNNDGIIDTNDMNVIKDGLNKVRQFKIELTPEYQKELNDKKETEKLINDSNLLKAQLANDKTKIAVALEQEELTALQEFKAVLDNPNSTEEQIADAKLKLAAVHGKIKELMGSDASGESMPKNDTELYWRCANGDEAACAAINMKENHEIVKKATGTNSSVTHNHVKDSNGNVIGVQEGDLINKGGYYTDKKGNVTKISINKTMYNADDILPDKDSDLKGKILLVERDGKAYIQLPSENWNWDIQHPTGQKIREYLKTTFGWNYDEWANSGTKDASKFFPGAREEKGLLLIPSDNIPLSLQGTNSLGSIPTGTPTYQSNGGIPTTVTTNVDAQVGLEALNEE